MKTCQVCALEVEDTYQFCPDDGLSLGAISGTSVNKSASPSEVDDETDRAMVLYCPACAAEYPLTFSECPTHGVKLTRHNISRLTNRAAATATEPEFKSYSEPLTEPPEQGFERPGFRVAAIATLIALAVFALVGMYALLSSVSRRPSAPVARITEAAPQPFVPTPQEAQDYKEEQPAPVASRLPEPQPERTVEQKNHDASSTAERSARNKAADQSGAKPPVESRSESVNSMAKASMPQMPALPRGNSGGFDARLIRVRSSKTSSGFRYDLTFNMQEQAGRSAQWQRVLITTRSASGVNHSQAIPFAHRLGAAGALTFTISVELAGRSEADWQGRVVCTTLGWDNQGAPLQASFGANLTP